MILAGDVGGTKTQLGIFESGAEGRRALRTATYSSRDFSGLGAVLGELSVHRQWRRAAGVGVAAWIGFLIGTAVKVGLAFAMIAVFLTALFWR